MSKVLAPIHYGLYKKIVLFENIEKEIVEKTNRQMGHGILIERFGDYLPLAPLEDIIDHNNIHGWLQDAITVAERRQAALVFALMNDDVKLLDDVKKAYYDIGFETGTYFKIETALDVFTSLNQVLLDGMPCDRVNQMIEQSEDEVQWKTENCVHKENWDSQGVDVDLYYELRVAFTNGFIEQMTDKYFYKYSKEYQLHAIKRVL